MRYNKNMRHILSFFLFVLFLFPVPTFAQQLTGEHIKSFDSIIQIQQDGSILVTETIEYDFGSDQRHGIFRNIPFTKENNEGKTFKMDIDVVQVTDEQGKKYKFEESSSNGELQIKIGDPNKTLTGINTYVIDYTVKGALTYFSNFDELYWNVTGNGWEIPIGKATATVTLPTSPLNEEITADCYTGPVGSSNSICTKEINNSQLVFGTNNLLNQYEGLTIAVTFPKNIVSVLEPEEVIPFFDTLQGKITLILIILVGLLWYIIYPLYLPLRWLLKGRDPASHFGKAEALFEAPKTNTGRHLTPAETGVLIDEHAGPREISALVVDLAKKGYLKIIENKKNDFTLEKTKDIVDHSKLRDFEKTLLNGIFEEGNKLELKKAELYETVKKTQDQLYKGLVVEGYFPENPDKVRAFYVGMAAAAAITFNFLLLISLSIFGRLMPRKTLSGVEASNHSRSLKNFLKSQERQLEFQAQNQLFFEKLLPFAIAFGVEKIWAERFKELQLKQPEWYVSSTHTGFNTYSFTNSLNSSLSSFNSAANPPTSSSGFSSGSGGGGSSGGGGGGGGGGSW